MITITSAGLKKSYAQGVRLTNEITFHRVNQGGCTVVMYGSKGSGKTTLLLTLAQTIACENPDTKEAEKETVLWRGRSNDYWNWLPKEMVRIFIHKSDFNRTIFKDDELRVIPRKELPPMDSYTSIKDLYSKLRAGKINVIFEPSEYKITERIKKMVQRRGVVGDELFKTDDVDPVIFWFEFMSWLVNNKNPKFVSIIVDEADDLFPNSPSGGRWHLNLWAKDVMRDLRRRRISLYLACHGFQDLDARINSKLQYKLYMKGSVTPSRSLINHKAPVMLDPGIYYIERDAWGVHGFNKITEQSIILTYLQGDIDINDPLGGGDHDLVSGSPVKKKRDKTMDTLNKLQEMLNEISKSKNSGAEVNIDSLQKMVSGNSPTIKKKKPKTKKPEIKRKKYILPRNTKNDGREEHAKHYDHNVSVGKISDTPRKYDRNDLTTDEIDR